MAKRDPFDEVLQDLAGGNRQTLDVLRFITRAQPVPRDAKDGETGPGGLRQVMATDDESAAKGGRRE